MNRARISAMFLSFSLVMGLLTAGPLAAPTQAASFKVCGEISLYVKATALTPGTITVGAIPFVIAAGTDLASSIQSGANLCLDLTINASGSITEAAVSANVSASVEICGTVTAYAKATTSAAGSIKIAGRTFTIAVGAVLPAAIKVGANLCLDLTLDGFARVKGASVQANATAALTICGKISSYTKATLTSLGTLKIAGRTFKLAYGSVLPSSVRVGADLCLKLTINVIGQVQSASAQVNATTTLSICGKVSAYTEATLTSLGTLKIAGRTLKIAYGTVLPAAVRVNADLCATLTLNALGQVQGGTIIVNVKSTLEVCGQIAAYVAAGLTSNGSLTVAGSKRTLAAGAEVDSEVTVGAYVRLRLTVDALGRVSKVTVLAVGASISAVCVGNVPVPTPTPTPTSGPTPTPSSGPSPTPYPTPTPTPEPTPTPTPDPTPTPTPSPTPTPTGGTGPATATPSPDPAAGGVDSCVDDSDGDIAGTGQADTTGPLLPDTASLERTGWIVVTNALPLGLLGLFAAAAGWVLHKRPRTEDQQAFALGSATGDQAAESDLR